MFYIIISLKLRKRKNYNNSSVFQVAVALDNLEGFEIVSESIDGEICIQPGSSANLKVQLKGIALGSNNITVRAESAPDSAVCGSDSISDAIAKDAIRKSVIVEVSVAQCKSFC